MTGSRVRSKSFFGVTLLLAALVVGAIAAAISPAGVRELFTRDPPRADYDWLRRSLSTASHLADEASKGAHRGGTQVARTALRRAIVYSRISARRTGTKPIPAELRVQLQDYFPEELLDEVRWALPNEYLDLGSVVAAWYRADGGAVTLEDTIVYSTPAAARNRMLWAHELTHAMQYEELGLDDFVKVYVANPQLLEQQARDNAYRIEADILRRENRRAAPTDTDADGNRRTPRSARGL